jgi:hypothetical protein
VSLDRRSPFDDLMASVALDQRDLQPFTRPLWMGERDPALGRAEPIQYTAGSRPTVLSRDRRLAPFDATGSGTGAAAAGVSRRRDVTLPSGRVDLVDEHRRRRGRLGGSM